MSKHNYSQYYKKNASNQGEEVVAKATKTKNKPKAPVDYTKQNVNDNVIPDVPVEHVEPAAEVKMVVESVDTVSLPKTIIGTVIDCNKLNIRVNPLITASIIEVVERDAKVEIDPAIVDKEWFKVKTASGVEGYCMRKFVNAKL